MSPCHAPLHPPSYTPISWGIIDWPTVHYTCDLVLSLNGQDTACARTSKLLQSTAAGK